MDAIVVISGYVSVVIVGPCRATNKINIVAAVANQSCNNTMTISIVNNLIINKLFLRAHELTQVVGSTTVSTRLSNPASQTT